MQAICYRGYGNPNKLELCELPDPTLGPHDVRIKMLASAVQASDLIKIQGDREGSHTQTTLSQSIVAGKVGIGEVCEVGQEVKNLKIGNRVQMPAHLGTWRTHVTANCQPFIKIPKNLSTELAVQSYGAPFVAWRLLTDFVPLKPGDWVIQNGANTSTSHCIAQLCRLYGYSLISLVENASQVSELKALGSTHVLTLDQLALAKDITNGTSPTLGLASVGSTSIVKLIQSLAENSVLVMFGEIHNQAFCVPARELIFKNVQLRGFYTERWEQAHTDIEKQHCIEHIWELLQTKKLILSSSVKKFHLQDWELAITSAQKEGYGTSVLFVNE